MVSGPAKADADAEHTATHHTVVYREEVLACLFNKVNDIESFERMVRATPCSLGDETWKRLVRRLGCLNCCDPLHVSGLYNLELRFPDERRMAGVLSKLSLKERGENFRDPIFQSRMDRDPVPGWVLPNAWDVATYVGSGHKGVPTTGSLNVWYVTPDDAGDAAIPGVTSQNEQRLSLRKYFKVGLRRPLPATADLADIANSDELEQAQPRENRDTAVLKREKDLGRSHTKKRA